jgi:hypothetical protein
MASGCFEALLLVFVVIAFAVAMQAKNRIASLLAEQERQQRTLEYLGKRVSDLRTELAKSRGTTEEPEPQPQPEPIPEPAPIPIVEPEPIPIAAAIIVEEPVFIEPEPQPVAYEPPPPPPPPVVTQPPPAKSFDWEGLIGVKLFSWIAGIALVLAALFFLRYSVEQGWLKPIIRCSIGIITGIVLIVICELKIARGYKTTANAMHGAAIAILFATFFAAHALWHLASAGVVFAMMVLVTAVAVLLSIRRDSLFIALLGLVGGFATPALLSTGENKPVGLFSYLLLLNAGLAWVAYKKRWPHLTALSLLFTVLYQWGWTAKFLSAGQLPLAAAVFALFAVVAASSLWARQTLNNERQLIFDRIGLAGAALPLVFAIFTAAVPAYGARYNVLFGFLFFLTAGLAIIAATRGPQWLHLLGGIATLLTFVIWFSRSYDTRAYPGILAWIAAFVLLFLAADALAARFGNEYLGANGRAHTFAALLLFTIPTLILIEPRNASPWMTFGVLFVVMIAISAFAIVRNAGPTWFVAAFFALAAEAAWSAKYLSHERILTGLILYFVFALFFIGVPLLARRRGTTFEPRYGVSCVLLASIALLFFLAAGTVANASLWGVALLLAILNAGAMLEARHRAIARIAGFAALLSWLVIAVWWGSASVVDQLIPALAVITIFALLMVGGHLLAARNRDDADELRSGVWFGMVGHAFLFYVATQRELSVPPWPMLAVLFVLNLAIGAAALYLRRGKLWIAAMTASQLVLSVFAMATEASWATTSIVSTILIAAMSLAWIALAKRRGADIGQFITAAAVALYGAQVVAALASTHSLPLHAGAQTLILLAIMGLAAWSERHALVPGAIVMTTIASGAAPVDGPHPDVQRLYLASIVYAAFIAYPLILGRRAKKSFAPYLGAVLASIAFFTFAKDAIDEVQLDYAIGILPIFQSALMIVLLLRLLRIEPPGERMLNRLALIAAAALAFVTLAIPLQLEKQWITIGWALEGAALVWLFTRIPHRGLLIWSGALLAAVLVRLTVNPAIWLYHPPGAMKVINWYLYTYLVAAASFFAAAWFLPRDERTKMPFALPALNGSGGLLLFFLLNIEIADFYSTGPTLTFNFFSSSLAQDLTYTMGWAAFAVAMLIIGIVMRSRGARVTALILLVITILKCFLHDLGRLGGLYRVVSLLGLAMSLVLVGILLQRFVMVRPREEEAS